MRLHRRTWVCIVLSIVWIITAAIYAHKADVEHAKSFANTLYTMCTATNEESSSRLGGDCEAERSNNEKISMEGSYTNVAIKALAPVPFTWFVGFVLVYIVRAQLTGFRSVVPWNTLPNSKRLFVVFCCLGCLALVGIGAIEIIDLYVDTKVPVGMSPFLDVPETGHDYVTIAGTWTRTDLSEDTIANPLQTSKIECNKAENRCTEALASVSGNVLMADLVSYDIQSWTRDAIVLRRDFECSTELFTVDPEH